jgi:phosphotransferase system enzyme I (PtsI)
VSLCGEIAGDPRYTWILLGLGLRSFSMTAAELPAVKSVLQKTQLADARRLAEEALRLDGDQAIEALVRERMGDRFDAELGIIRRAAAAGPA